ncbi:MAG TPA: hypothetical protein VF837_00715 [Patescibacteria group bacterium]
MSDDGVAFHGGHGALSYNEIATLHLNHDKPNLYEYRETVNKFILLLKRFRSSFINEYSFKLGDEEIIVPSFFLRCESLISFGYDYFWYDESDGIITRNNVTILEDLFNNVRDANSRRQEGRGVNEDSYPGRGAVRDNFFDFDPGAPAYNPFPGDGGTANRPSPRPSADGGSPSGGSSGFPSQG